MDKFDWKKDLKALYFPPMATAATAGLTAPVVVDVPPIQYLMVDGQGNPNNNPVYQAAVEALYSLAYTLKFALKKADRLDYAVFPLEGLWWEEDMSQFSVESKSRWQWRMMIAQPSAVTAEDVDRARAEALRKKGITTADVRLETYAEGRAAQLMHLGPYSAEKENIARLHAFIASQGCALRGLHHEIYLSDPNRAAPDKLKTVIRQPME